MKRNVFVTLFALVVVVGVVEPNVAVGRLLTQSTTASQVQVSGIDKQVEVLEGVQQDLESQVSNDQAVLESLSDKITVLKKQIEEVTLADDEINKEFLGKKLSIMSRSYQNASEILRTRKAMLEKVREHVTILEGYKVDPLFEKLRHDVKATTNFKDLQKSAQALFAHKEERENLKREQKNARRDSDQRKKALNAVIKDYEEKQNEQRNFDDDTKVAESLKTFSRNQQGEILDAQLQQLGYKKELAQLKVNEDEIRLAFLETRLKIVRKQIAILQDDYTQVKRSLIIDKSYIKKIEDSLKKDRQKFFDLRDQYNDQISNLFPQVERVKKDSDQVIKQHDLTPSQVTVIRDWDKTPDSFKTVKDWVAAASLGSFGAREIFLKTLIDGLQAKTNLAKIRFEASDRELNILRSWYRITQRRVRFDVDDEIEKEIKRYENERVHLNTDLAELYERRESAYNLISRLQVAQGKTKELVKVFSKQKNVLFAREKGVYLKIEDAFVNAKKYQGFTLKHIGEVLDSYNKSIAIIQDSIKKVDDIINELSAKSFWMRSDQSIELRDIKNFFPDVRRFASDVKQTGLKYLQQLDLKDEFNAIVQYLKTPYAALLFLLRFVIALIVFLLLRIYVPELQDFFLQGQSRYRIISRFSALSAALLGFLSCHLISLYVWFLMFLLIQFNFIDSFISILFYLLSIPYLLLICHLFVQHLVSINKKRSYIFISKHYEHRFVLVTSLLSYATIIIYFFRRAFVLGNYYNSQVADILFAVNIILLQIALISLISKELIIGMVSARPTPFSQWIEERVEKFYYIFLLFFIAIVVMINPYVGFGRQVLYVLSRLLFTAILIPVFSWVHNRVKRASSDFFFYYSEGSAVKERFTSGKTWYGMFIIASFFFFVFLGVVIVAKIWGQGIAVSDIIKWFNYTLYSPGIDEVTGKPINVSLMSLWKIVLYIAGGFVIAYIMNRFVLRRIFDPLLIGSGVQNTITTLSRYVVLLLALLIGLQSAGLEAMATKMVVILGLVSFAVKEPIADFFSYFIILVQRPIKIGDLIQIEPDIFGVVRHITPRSTIVRHKNSLPLVVPNSRIITSTVRNWHHTRTFSAFPDIQVTVPYSVDPARARTIMYEVLNASPNVLKNPKPIVWLTDFVDNGYHFVVRGFLSSDKVIDLFEIASQVRIDLVARLREEGMRIGTPTRRIHFDKNDLQNTCTSLPENPPLEPQYDEKKQDLVDEDRSFSLEKNDTK